MNIRRNLIAALLTIIMAAVAPAQRRGMEPGPGMRDQGRLEKFRMMRLIEVLKLSEEDAVRFYAKNSAHEDKVRELMKSRNSMLDDIEKMARDKKGPGELQSETDKILAVDQQIFAERVRYQGEIRKMLTPDKFALFLVYERNFGRRVRNAMEDMRRERREKEDN
jgi:hypothetical protein